MVEIFEMNKNTENLFSEELFSAQIERHLCRLVAWRIYPFRSFSLEYAVIIW